MAKANYREGSAVATQQVFTILEAAEFLRISRRTLFNLIGAGKIQTIKLSSRMVRITLDELLRLAETSGYQVIMPDEKKKAATKPETGSVNKKAKCRKTPANEIAPDGVTHDDYYTKAEILSKFNIKYGILYDMRKRYQLESVHAWGTTCFKKEDIEAAVARYNDENGRAVSDAYYTCFDIMQKFGLGNKREYLTKEELVSLSKSNCKNDVLWTCRTVLLSGRFAPV